MSEGKRRVFEGSTMGKRMSVGQRENVDPLLDFFFVSLLLMLPMTCVSLLFLWCAEDGDEVDGDEDKDDSPFVPMIPTPTLCDRGLFSAALDSKAEDVDSVGVEE